MRHKFFILILLGLFTGLLFLGYKTILLGQIQKHPQVESTVEKGKRIDLTLDFGEEKVATFSHVFAVSPYDALRLTDKPIEIAKYDFGIMVKKINNLENSKSYSWLYFVNGKAGDVASDEYKLKDGDRVEWKYMKMDK